MTHPSPVLELQALAQSAATDIGELARKARTVAVKLGLGESAKWLEHEVGGYPTGAVIPEYRVIPCQLQVLNPAHGWQPVEWQEADWVWKHFKSASCTQSLAEIQHLVSNAGGTLLVPLTPPETALLLKVGSNFNDLQAAKIIQRSSLAAILDAVRYRILNWALDLERQGAVGNGTTFSPAEQQHAASVTINFGTHVASAQNSPGSKVVAASSAAPAVQAAEARVVQAGEQPWRHQALKSILMDRFALGVPATILAGLIVAALVRHESPICLPWFREPQPAVVAQERGKPTPPAGPKRLAAVQVEGEGGRVVAEGNFVSGEGDLVRALPGARMEGVHITGNYAPDGTLLSGPAGSNAVISGNVTGRPIVVKQSPGSNAIVQGNQVVDGGVEIDQTGR